MTDPSSFGTDLSAFGTDPWWLVLVKVIAVFAFLVLTVLAAIYLERKVIAWMQMRVGPNRVGPLGMLQSLADGVKIALKEGLTPAGVDKPIYLLAPVIAVIPSRCTASSGTVVWNASPARIAAFCAASYPPMSAVGSASA